MYRKLLFFCCLVLGLFNVNAQEFGIQQQAWLYKIVRKTPCLKRNLDPYFQYSGGIPEKGRVMGEGKGLSYGVVSLWDSIENDILLKPEVLSVDWEGIHKASPGVLAEAAVKLTLWELYSNIKDGYHQVPLFSGNDIAKGIYDEAVKALPAEMRSGGLLKKKYHAVFLELINPSLNIGRKLEAFSRVRKVNAASQKLFFDRWHKEINSYVEKYSAMYFGMLCGREVFFKGELLAVGEGSGSSGLLREYEDRDGGYMATGTGKGIGLFTYKMKVRKGMLEPDSNTQVTVKALEDEPTLLHLSLWGMDWSKKPLVVVSNGDKSYLLFGSGEFSPDPLWRNGSSYLDMLEDYRAKMIDKPIRELNKEGGLLSVYEREQTARDKIQQQIDRNNKEVDSLRKQVESSEAAIQQRIKKNEVNLRNLSAKEKKLKELQRNITAEYHRADEAQKKLDVMRSELGGDVQEWKFKDSIYTFKDGATFNLRTQDFILYDDSLQPGTFEIKLLAASYSVYSDKKDEVQLYVNVTGGVDKWKEVQGVEEVEAKVDTLYDGSIYFGSNQYCTSSVKEIISGISECAKDSNAVWAFDLRAHGVDTLNHQFADQDKINYQLHKNLARYVNSRRVDVRVVRRDSMITVNIDGYTDAGNTRLLNVSDSRLKVLNRFQSPRQSMNVGLSALRVYYIVKEFEKHIGLDLSQKDIKALDRKIEIVELIEN
ncbi:hypothetical protein [Plebeiibacterium marinum]|uniref:Uncharacterized protein n=1 Tax=Plebeiibacterium marinum TaxID=2992111 RepID=A0AAE3MGW1_9BACT|nr:hypothetical protein [Plebeiobacterium marinum]MCW3807559.1 hypothetical protein [Plebeiobacterium marinum]